MNRNRKGESDVLLVISNLGLELVLSRMNFGQLHIEIVSVIADLTHWRSSGESACLLCKMENVGQRTRSRIIQENT